MRYIFSVILIAAAVLAFKVYTNVLSKDIEFGMGNLQIIKQNGDKLDLSIKVADTINERARGLMFVKEMPDGDGMLFIFEKEEMRKMWMENTYLPLDMLFINKNKVIFNFKENAVPMSQEIIYSVGPALYVLELNAGFIKRHGIKPGDKIEYQIGK